MSLKTKGHSGEYELINCEQKYTARQSPFRLGHVFWEKYMIQKKKYKDKLSETLMQMHKYIHIINLQF